MKAFTRKEKNAVLKAMENGTLYTSGASWVDPRNRTKL